MRIILIYYRSIGSEEITVPHPRSSLLDPLIKEMLMNSSEFHPGSETYTLPSAEALIAGTLALMTGYAQAEVASGRRLLLARKLVSNLGSLAEHPQMSEAMQTVLNRLQGHWLSEITRADKGAEQTATRLWHPVVTGLQ